MKDNISSAQWITIMGASVAAVLMMNYLRLFVEAVGRGAYVSALLLAAITFVLLLIAILSVRANGFRSPIEVTAEIIGKKGSLCLCAIAALGFFLFTAETLNIYIYIIKFYFLPRTPTLLLTAVLFLPAVYMAYCGLHTFGSMASASVLAFALFLLMFPFTKNNYFPANLMPWSDFQWREILSSLPFLFLSAPAIAASFFMLPYCSDRRHLLRKSLIFAALFGFLMIFLYFAGMAYFGENVIKKLILPFYNLSPFFKGNLPERFDILYMLALLPSVTVFDGFAFSVFTLIQQNLLPRLNAKHRGKTVLVFAFCAVLLSRLTIYRLSIWKIYRYCNLAALILIGIFLLLYFCAALKNRRNPS